MAEEDSDVWVEANVSQRKVLPTPRLMLLLLLSGVLPSMSGAARRSCVGNQAGRDRLSIASLSQFTGCFKISSSAPARLNWSWVTERE